MEDASPLVYISILNYNGKIDTEECLNSIKKLNYNNFKTVVLDNGSTDDSVSYLKEKFPGIELIENNKNLGFAEGNNVGIKYALMQGAEYVLILNNDTIVSTSFLKNLIDVATKDKTIGIIGPKILYYDKRDRIWFAGGKIYLWLGNSWHIGNRRKDSDRFNKIIEEDYQTGCALLIKKETINRIGMFDSQYTAYFEDVDLCRRVKEHKYKVVCVQYAKIWHKISRATGGTLSAQKAYLKTKSGVKFFRRYSPRFAYYTTVPISTLCYIILASAMEKITNNRNVFYSFIRGLISGIKDSRTNQK